MTPQDLYSLDRDPTFDQLKNAFNGRLSMEQRKMEALRNLIYDAARFNAASTALSNEQAKAIGEFRFPWETSAAETELSVHDKIGSFIRREEMRLRKKHGN